MNNKCANQTISGIATARGFAIGPVFIYRGTGEVPVPEYIVEEGREDDEWQRLQHALTETRRDIEGLIATLRVRTGSDDVRIFECHLMLLEDELLLSETERYIRESRLNAAAAVRKTVNHARRQFAQMNDPYFRERVRDLDDVERRLLRAITGFSGEAHLELKAPAIVVADDLTPSETVQLPREFVLGFATNGGSATSHVALLARAMGIPAVTGLENITAYVTAGETILLDGTNGSVTLTPDEAAIQEFTERVERQKEIVEEVSAGASVGQLKGGGRILLYANIHPGVPVGNIRQQGARGVGLYRSEYLWLTKESEPSEEEQFEAYRDAATFTMTLGPEASLTIRTLDIGGDKLVRGLSEKEANPFLGNRSIRYLLTHRDVFRTQLRAILRASVFGKIAILYPMVSCVEELKEAAKILEGVKRQLDAEGVSYRKDILVGAMIEVPSAALNAEALAKHVDFFSIGTNDLIQYTMAADRGNETVAHLYQPTNPAVLKLMRMTVRAARERGIYVGVCGESASDPIVGVLWAAMGVDLLSMSATYIPLMSKLFSHLTRADLDEYARTIDEIPSDATGEEVYARCREWVFSHVPDVDPTVL